MDPLSPGNDLSFNAYFKRKGKCMKRSGKIVLMAMVVGLLICGVGFAENAPLPERAQQMERAADIFQPDSIELTGTILSDNTFVDESGENYQLMDSEASKDLQAHVGQKLKVTATVSESDEGVKNLSISSYELIEE